MGKKKESKPEEGKPEVEITLSGGKKIEVVSKKEKQPKTAKKPKAVKLEAPEKEEVKEEKKEGIAPYPW